MTALSEYERLEATGLWRDAPDSQRREVLVSLGDATLIISTMTETALSHWSLPAIRRLNPGKTPALYAPDPGADEVLELDAPEMIAAIERVRGAIERARPRPGRLRLMLGLGSLAAVVLAGVLLLPAALTHQTVAVLPDATRAAIGRTLLAEMTSLAGRPCAAPAGIAALSRLSRRTLGDERPPRVVVLPGSVTDTLGLPGNMIVINSALVEDHETPEVLAGHLLAEAARRSTIDPMQRLLEDAGLGVTLRLLTTGNIAANHLHAHAAHLLVTPATPVDDTAMLARFAAAGISSQPYAYARDVSGETTLALIEGDPLRGQSREGLLPDEDWIALQEICGN